jgi:acyl homoserine lactone synthase
MMYLISKEHRGHECNDTIEAMFRLRYRVFKERLEWEVACEDGKERDRFDDCDPVYLIYRGETGAVEGCIRMLSTLGPNMLRDVFDVLLDGAPAPASPAIWESSRFSLDTDTAARSGAGLCPATHELFAGMIEFGLAWGLKCIVTVTDARVERILRRAGWPLERIGTVHRLGNTTAVAGFLEVSHRALTAVREIGGLKGPVLWIPAPLLAAAA